MSDRPDRPDMDAIRTLVTEQERLNDKARAVHGQWAEHDKVSSAWMMLVIDLALRVPALLAYIEWLESEHNTRPTST